MTDEADSTAAALKRLEEDGSDLNRPMEIDFFAAVPNKVAGKQVEAEARKLGYSTAVEQDEDTGEWTCYCTKKLVPVLAAVEAIEREIDTIARRYGGHGDGFGSFGNGPHADKN
jgi:regulator of RNase E activity RraB